MEGAKQGQWVAAEENISRHLLSNEHVLWVGPRVHTGFRSDDWIGAISVAALALFLSFILLNNPLFERRSSVSFSSDPGLILLLVVVAAISIITTIQRWWSRKRTFYAITNQRVIIVRSHALKRHFISIYPQHMKQFEVIDQGNEIGDVVLGYEPTGSPNSVRVPYGVLGVKNVRQVEALILETFAGEAKDRSANPSPGASSPIGTTACSHLGIFSTTWAPNLRTFL